MTLHSRNGIGALLICAAAIQALSAEQTSPGRQANVPAGMTTYQWLVLKPGPEAAKLRARWPELHPWQVPQGALPVTPK